MEKEEINRLLVEFRNIIAQRTDLADDIRPDIPTLIVAAKRLYNDFLEDPDIEKLSFFWRLHPLWRNLERSYGRNVRRCKRRLHRIGIDSALANKLNECYDALVEWTTFLGTCVKKEARIAEASYNSVGKMSRFKSWMEMHAQEVHDELYTNTNIWVPPGYETEQPKRRGGIITCNRRGFSLEYRENPLYREFESQLESFYDDPTRAGEFYDFLMQSMGPIWEKTKGEGSDRLIRSFEASELFDLEILRERGELTDSLLRYLEFAFGVALYKFDSGVLDDDSMFRGRQRFFAHFYENPDNPNILYANDYRGPPNEQLRHSFFIGPSVVFAPRKRALEVYLTSAGEKFHVGIYDVE